MVRVLEGSHDGASKPEVAGGPEVPHGHTWLEEMQEAETGSIPHGEGIWQGQVEDILCF